MPKKSRKGFYVKGEFVSEAAPPAAQSRTAKKKAAERLQEIGEQLVGAKAPLLNSLPLPEALRDAIDEARAMTSPGASRRQRQLIGKLMQRLDDDEVDAVCAAMNIER
jgi:ribosome-associated protein